MATTTRLGITKLAEASQQKEIQINTAWEVFDTMAYSDMGEYTFVNLPAASANTNAYALCTNASGGRTVVRSNGTNWMVIAVEGIAVAV